MTNKHWNEILATKNIIDQYKAFYSSFEKNIGTSLNSYSYYDDLFYYKLFNEYRTEFSYTLNFSSYTHEVIRDIERMVTSLAQNITDQTEPTLILLQRLCANAERLLNEINILITSGFANGAFILTRSIYEIFALSNFISKYKHKAAIAFLNYKKADYNWIKQIDNFKNERYISINFMIKNSGINYKDWKEYNYIQNLLVHSNLWGLKNSLSNYDEIHFRSVGPSNAGLAYPAEHSVKHITSIVRLYLFETIDVLNKKAYLSSDVINNVRHKILNHLSILDNMVFQIEKSYHKKEAALKEQEVILVI